MDAVTSGRVTIHPERYAKSYLDWLGEKRDWCISRQLWWGHRIPIWHCGTCTEDDLERAFDGRADVAWRQAETGGWLVCAETDLRGDELGPGHALVQDPDVLDTWFSSALWPHSTLGWPDETPELAKYLSDQRAVDGPRHHHALGCADGDLRPVQPRRRAVPRRLHPPDHPGWAGASGCRSRRATASTRSTSSKSTAPTPCATRWRPARPRPRTCGSRSSRSSSPDGRVVNTSERFELGRNFANKFWNAARLDLDEPRRLRAGRDSSPKTLPIEDRWILDGLDRHDRAK